jgi:hypothetical protein
VPLWVRELMQFHRVAWVEEVLALALVGVPLALVA